MKPDIIMLKVSWSFLRNVDSERKALLYLFSEMNLIRCPLRLQAEKTDRWQHGRCLGKQETERDQLHSVNKQVGRGFNHFQDCF